MKNTSSLLFRQKRLAYRTSKKKSDSTFTNMRHNQSTEGSKRAEFWTGLSCFFTQQRRRVFKTMSLNGSKDIWWAPRVIRTAKSDTAYIAVSPWNPWSPNKLSRICHREGLEYGDRVQKYATGYLELHTRCAQGIQTKKTNVMCLFDAGTNKQLLHILDPHAVHVLRRVTKTQRKRSDAHQRRVCFTKSIPDQSY